LPRTLLLTELPEALPDRGVLLVQTRPRRPDTLQRTFLDHLATVYRNRGAELVHEDYYDRPWQIRIQDSALLLQVGNALQNIRDAGRHGAVVMRVITQGPDNGAWRHQEVEQHLVDLLTARGAAVSVLRVTGPTKAQATLYRRSPAGELPILLEWFDLESYLQEYAGEFDD
jgi:hypothetical protein